MTIHITGMAHGYNLPNWKVDDYVVDMDSGDVSRIGLGGHKGFTLYYVGNIYRPAANDTVQAIVDGLATSLRLGARC